MTAVTHDVLAGHLLRDDRQEDICMATYRPSTGATRRTALVRRVVLPETGERAVHGNASLTGAYVLRAAALAHEDGCGVVLAHSHPGGRGWQNMSGPDRDAETAYANLVREITGLPLVGMTLAGDQAWSARHWDLGTGRDVEATHAENVRVLGDRLVVSWNDALVPPPSARRSQVRAIASWGPRVHRDLTRRAVLVVGAGSVGLDIAVRLAATGVTRIGLMDFDTVEERNLDRLVGATKVDAWLRRSKVDVVGRLVVLNATAAGLQLETSELSVCEPAGLAVALDFDIIFSCVDRPWARGVLNSVAYAHLLPVVDGGMGVDAFADGNGMRGAAWRSHVVRPGRPCLACNGQLDLAAVTADRAGDLDDPQYIAGLGGGSRDRGENVAALSVSAAASLLAQYVSLSVAPGGLGEPGPLRYILSTHTLEHVAAETRPTCPVEATVGDGDAALTLAGPHAAAEHCRADRHKAGQSWEVRLGRAADDLLHRLATRLGTVAEKRLGTS
ncbi:ThiF family adenylyltransferase [Blastococcus sp. CT_GayMR20]|uniref:ThiF family adenylyltransferase n=1 Tax=Blastococcus sp. CT_GayMR20 TaxID=2559609 RepID=UPI0014317B15|nr:ThiF family adenylyltransferase [Blastococcus sp. CT_GayMR20]